MQSEIAGHFHFGIPKQCKLLVNVGSFSLFLISPKIKICLLDVNGFNDNAKFYIQSTVIVLCFGQLV